MSETTEQPTEPAPREHRDRFRGVKRCDWCDFQAEFRGHRDERVDRCPACGEHYDYMAENVDDEQERRMTRAIWRRIATALDSIADGVDIVHSLVANARQTFSPPGAPR